MRISHWLCCKFLVDALPVLVLPSSAIQLTFYEDNCSVSVGTSRASLATPWATRNSHSVTEKTNTAARSGLDSNVEP